MTQEELREIAESIILNYTDDISGMSVGERAEDFLGPELSDDEYDAAIDEIESLVSSAKVTVTWDE